MSLRNPLTFCRKERKECSHLEIFLKQILDGELALPKLNLHTLLVYKITYSAINVKNGTNLYV